MSAKWVPIVHRSSTCTIPSLQTLLAITRSTTRIMIEWHTHRQPFHASSCTMYPFVCSRWACFVPPQAAHLAAAADVSGPSRLKDAPNGPECDIWPLFKSGRLAYGYTLWCGGACCCLKTRLHSARLPHRTFEPRLRAGARNARRIFNYCKTTINLPRPHYQEQRLRDTVATRRLCGAQKQPHPSLLTVPGRYS